MTEEHFETWGDGETEVLLYIDSDGDFRAGIHALSGGFIDSYLFDTLSDLYDWLESSGYQYPAPYVDIY